MIRVFIGFDRAEAVAAPVLAHSIVRHSRSPVSITPIVTEQLPLTRPRDPLQSTAFSFSRFLVPWMCGYEGKSIYMDCDMLCRADIGELWRLLPSHRAVAVVKHDYVPRTACKFLDNEQTPYRRKNWSSVMVFNNAACRTLTPGYVNEATGLALHQFAWLEDHQIEALPAEWNHLVGEYEPNPQAKLAHFTLGTPCFRRYERCEFADDWRDERRLMLACSEA